MPVLDSIRRKRKVYQRGSGGGRRYRAVSGRSITAVYLRRGSSIKIDTGSNIALHLQISCRNDSFIAVWCSFGASFNHTHFSVTISITLPITIIVKQLGTFAAKYYYNKIV